MNNLNVWQHPGCGRDDSRVAFDERCMLKWQCGKKKKRIHPKFNLLCQDFKSDTETCWQIWNMKQGGSRWKHGSFANTCLSGCFLKFNLSQWLFPYKRAYTGWRLQFKRVNRLQKCDTRVLGWQPLQINLRWNNVVVHQTWVWIQACQRTPAVQRQEEKTHH